MSTVGMSVNSKEFEAAQALLDLQNSNNRESTNERNDRQECVEAGQLFLNCFIASNVAQQPIKDITSPKVGTVNTIYAVAKSTTTKSNVVVTQQPNKVITTPKVGTVSRIYGVAKSTTTKSDVSTTQQPIKTITSSKVGTVSPIYAIAKSTNTESDVATTRSPKRKTPDQEFTNDCQNHTYHCEESSNKPSKVLKGKPIKQLTVTSGPVPSFVSSRNSNSAKKDNVSKVSVTKIKTRDVGTQTEENQHPTIDTMKLIMSPLREKIKSLEEKIKSNLQPVETIDHDVSGNGNDDDDKFYKVNSNEMTMDDSDGSDSEMDETFNDLETPEKVKTKHRAGQCYENRTKVLSNRNVNANADDLVPIGNGNALIPSKIFRHVNWSSYTCATRKLLMAVFTRRILATHSLTGKPSPAFPNKPAKKKLDPALVRDIVQTVADRCCVTEKLVKTSITTKCADESKMFRTRENNTNKKKLKRKVNRENISPESESD